MPDRSSFSRVLRAFGRLLRRLTIGLAALIVLLYYFGDWAYFPWPYPACSEANIEPFQSNGRGDVAEIAVHGCVLGLFNRQYRVRVRPADRSRAKIVVRFDPKGRPALHWLDLDHLQAVLGDVRSLSPQIDQAGPIHITFIYSGANPSLDRRTPPRHGLTRFRLHRIFGLEARRRGKYLCSPQHRQYVS